MNRRTLKKHCARAREILIRDYGFSPDAFHKSEGDESINAPPQMERRFVKDYAGCGAWLEPGPLKGTWLYWRRTSYEYDEWDCDLTIDVLSELVFQQSITIEDVEGLFSEDCPGHVASKSDPKICGRCGIHIDELRPPDDFIDHVAARGKSVEEDATP